jgi:hypothetical protein
VCYIWGKKNFPVPYRLATDGIYLLGSFALVYAITHFVQLHNFWYTALIRNALFLVFIAFILYAERKEWKQFLRKPLPSGK